MILRIDAKISSMLGSPLAAALLMIYLVCLQFRRSLGGSATSRAYP
jgi:hypothetical protein